MLLICFDMDGTVIDSMPTLTTSAIQVICQFYKLSPEEAKQQYLKSTGIPFFQQLEKLFPKDFRNGNAAREYEHIHRSWCPDFPLAPNIKEARMEIKRAGHKAALVTSTDYHLLKYLPQIRSLQFDHVDGFSQGRSKIEQIQRVQTIFSPSKTVMLGDTIYDSSVAMTTGAEFHMVTCSTVAGIVLNILKEARETVHHMS